MWTGPPPPPPGQYTGERAEVAVGLLVPVEYVRAFPTASRVLGMRSNVYPIYALGVLVFALAGVGLLWDTPRNLHRVRFLLGAGVENTKRQTLDDPAGHLLSLLLTDPAPRQLGIRDGQLHAPSLLAWVVVLLLPVGGFLLSAAYLWHHWAAISYTWHSLVS